MQKIRLRICVFLIALTFCNFKAQAAQSVTLAWDANTASNIIGYRLYAGTTSGVYTQEIEVGNNTSTLVSNLADGTTYFFTVTDYDTSGVESVHSNEVSYTAPAATPTPTPTPAPTPTPTPSPVATPTPTPTPDPTPTPSPTPTVGPSPTPTRTPSPTPIPSVTPSPTPTPSATPTPSPTPTVDPSPTPTRTPSPTPTPTPTPFATPSPMPTPTPTPHGRGHHNGWR
jgi:hypothetical protein